MLRLLNAGVAKHQLNDPDVNGVREQPTRALVTQVVPAEIDSSVDCRVHRLERAMHRRRRHVVQTRLRTAWQAMSGPVLHCASSASEFRSRAPD